MNASAHARKQQKMTNFKTSLAAVVLAYDGFDNFELAGGKFFGLPRPEMGDDWYQFAVASVDGGELRAAGGIRILADGDLPSARSGGSGLFIPGWRAGWTMYPKRSAGRRQRQRMPRGCQLLDLFCFGDFRSGSLRPVPTGGRQPPLALHASSTLSAITVVEDACTRRSGDILTSAGSAAEDLLATWCASELMLGRRQPRGASTGDPAPSGRLRKPSNLADRWLSCGESAVTAS